MASASLVLPGVIFVGEDKRARLVAHTGGAAGWMLPVGILGWSSELSVVPREALTEDIRRTTKTVMPEEQIAQARFPLTAAAAQRAPVVAVSSKLGARLVEVGVRVHTVGVDNITSSFYYIAEGGGEEATRVEGDLVQAVGAMLGDRADNDAIEDVMDGLVDRLLRFLSKERVTELSVELAASLPRAAADGTGLQDIDIEAFERELAKLFGESEKYVTFARQIAAKLGETTAAPNADLPLYGQAKRLSQGPFELSIGDKKLALPTYDRWVMSGPLVAPPPEPKVEPKAAPKVDTKPPPAPAPAPVEVAAAKPAPAPEPAPVPKAEAPKVEAPAPKVEAPKVEAPKVEAPKVEAPKAEFPKTEPVRVEEPAPKAEPKPEPAVAKEAPKVEAKKEPAAAKAADGKAVAAKSAAKAPVDVDPDGGRLATTVKVRRPEPAKSTGGLAVFAVMLAIAAGVLAWRLWFTK